MLNTTGPQSKTAFSKYSPLQYNILAAPTYAMATEQLEDLEIVEETPPTMPTEQEPKKLLPAKKKPGPHNPDQAAESVVETNQNVDRFMNKMHNYEPYAIEEGYQVLIAEYHHALCGIEDYFKQADRNLY